MTQSEIIQSDVKKFIEDKKHLQPVIYPIINSSTYKINNLNNLNEESYTYSRSDNPTRNILEKNFAKLENAEYGLSFSSGLGAITCICNMNIAKDGIMASSDLYGGTKRYFNNVQNETTLYFNFHTLSKESIQYNMKNIKAKLVWIETPSNPMLNILDIKMLAEVCHQNDKLLCVDNTFLSPIFQKPLALGADMVVHSVSKYINGMSDVIMGCVMTNNNELYKELKFLQNAMGIIPSPFDCYLVNRSIKTLELRMIKHAENAFKIANLLEKHDLIEKVIYPGFANHKNRDIIKTQMTGPGGMISFYLKGTLEETTKFLESLKHIPIAESLGGVETLIEHPALMTHSGIDKEERERIGITDNLVRLSVGIEDYQNIYQDIEASLNAIQNC